MPDLAHPHAQQLSEFDRLLAHGPYYEKLAIQGAVAGGVLSLLVGKGHLGDKRGTFSHAVTYGLAGAGIAVGGAVLLFGLGKFVSGRSHEAIAAGQFSAGWHGGHGGGHGFHHHHHGMGQGQGQGQGVDPSGGDDDDDQPPFPPPPPHHGFNRFRR